MKCPTITMSGARADKAKHPLQLFTCITGSALMFTALNVNAVPVYVPIYNPTEANVVYADSSGNGSVSDPASAQHNYPYSTGLTSGYVSVFGTTSSGIPASASGTYASASNGGYSSTTASYATTTLIGAGTSGLAPGTAVTLQLIMQIDGTSDITNGSDAGYSSLQYDFSIRNVDRPEYSGSEDGWSVPTIASFSAGFDHNVDNYYSRYYDPAGGYYQQMYYHSIWNRWSNLVDYEAVNVEDILQSARSDTPYGSASDSRSFDTGLVQFDFLAYVGDTLNIDSYLQTWGDTYGSGSVVTIDFLNTMQTSITSPYVNGLELIMGGVGVPAVPVPAAIWLFGSGLLGLITVARRKTRS